MKTKDFEGVRFYIDRPKGFVKTWDLPDGSKKTYTYPVDYGYFPKILGEDGGNSILPQR
jgi:inorganic pyrophosphatase